MNPATTIDLPDAGRAGGSTHVRVDAKGETYEFDCAPGERILHAGLRAGVDLPYECASGTCGTCKANLVEGETTYVWEEAPGRRFVKPEKGEFLMCQSVAHTDCLLSVAKRIDPTAGGRLAPVHLEATLERVRTLAPDVIAFDAALDQPISFHAGQFVLLEVPAIPGARSYSMVNFTRDTRRLEFVIKRFPGGKISDWLFGGGQIEGSRVRIFGPLGHATFDPSIAKHIVCIAGGSGIAGMMSILSHADEDRYFERHDGKVFFGVRTGKDVFYIDELAEFARRYPERLTITIALSHEEPPAGIIDKYPELRFESAFVHEAVKRVLPVPLTDTMAYVAGPPPMVDATLRMLLLEFRLRGDNIRYDKFS